MITIHTFYGQDAPEGLRAIARIRMQMPGPKGGLKLDWCPVVFHADTEDLVRDKAQVWWDKEFAKFKAREAHYHVMAKARKEKAKISVIKVAKDAVTVEAAPKIAAVPPKLSIPGTLKPAVPGTLKPAVPGVPKPPSPVSGLKPPTSGSPKPPSMRLPSIPKK